MCAIYSNLHTYLDLNTTQIEGFVEQVLNGGSVFGFEFVEEESI